MKFEKHSLKYQIEKELIKHKWDIATIGENEEWWDDEHWKFVLKYNTRISFYICFIVDPMVEGTRKKGEWVYCVRASSCFPDSFNDCSHEIASIDLYKGPLNIQREIFMAKIDKYRKCRLNEDRKNLV